MTDEMSEATPGADAAATPDETPVVRSPGDMIRTARERARLSVEDLAVQIKLARPTLEALERDDFNQLLEPVYVRGYYRKCAKVLGLPEKELIDAYQGRAMPKAPVAPSKLRLASGSELGTGNRLPLPMAIIAALFAVFICVFGWNMLETPSRPPPQVALPPPMALPLAPAPENTVTPLSPEASGETLSAPALQESPAGVAPAAAVTPAASKPAAGLAMAPAAAAALPGGSVTLEFTGTSWVKIDDAAGNTLISDLRKEGDRQVLNGKLPFTVFLGNAPAVTVEFEGKPVDFSSRIAENATVRFTLPASARP